MRKYKSHLENREVDLDNPKTFKHLPNDWKALDNLMFREIGYALCYMDYFADRKGLFPTKKLQKDKVHKYCGYMQRQRVQKLVKKFADGRHLNYDNPMWFKEQ